MGVETPFNSLKFYFYLYFYIFRALTIHEQYRRGKVSNLYFSPLALLCHTIRLSNGYINVYSLLPFCRVSISFYPIKNFKNFCISLIIIYTLYKYNVYIMTPLYYIIIIFYMVNKN